MHHGALVRASIAAIYRQYRDRFNRRNNGLSPDGIRPDRLFSKDFDHYGRRATHNPARMCTRTVTIAAARAAAIAV